jgi:hypothetical protein
VLVSVCPMAGEAVSGSGHPCRLYGRATLVWEGCMCTGLLTSHSDGSSGGANGERAWPMVTDLEGSLVCHPLCSL